MNTYKIETLESTYRVYYIEAKDEETAEEILHKGDCNPAKQKIVEDEIIEITKMFNHEKMRNQHSTQQKQHEMGLFFEE